MKYSRIFVRSAVLFACLMAGGAEAQVLTGLDEGINAGTGDLIFNADST
jgi:hypothetical protein